LQGKRGAAFRAEKIIPMKEKDTSRRGFFGKLAGLIALPAIINEISAQDNGREMAGILNEPRKPGERAPELPEQWKDYGACSGGYYGPLPFAKENV
jgi:hypothetical protein